MYELVSRKKIYRDYLDDYLHKITFPKNSFNTTYMTSNSCGELENRRKSGVIKSHRERFLAEVLSLPQSGKLGFALFDSPETAYVLMPPFQLLRTEEFTGCNFSQLLEVVNRPRHLLVILIRMGRYAAGIIDGDKIIESKSGTRYVKNRHRAGGSSQRRFERSRERLIREFYDDVCIKLKNLVEVKDHKIDSLVYGGEKDTIRGFNQRCKFVQNKKIPTLDRILEINRPGREELYRAVNEVYSCVIYKLRKTDNFQ